MRQRTIKKEVSISGIGVHTGKRCRVRLKPGKSGTGIIFIGKKIMPARIAFCKPFTGCNLLEKDGMVVQTPEHLLATLYGLGIDNVECWLDSEELPALDGSALPYVKMIKDSGVIEQEKEKNVLEIKRPVRFSDNDRTVIGVPGNDFTVSFLIDYGHPWLVPQYASFHITPEIFEREIAPARTYCLREWVTNMRERGLIKGGSLKNAIVVGENGPIGNASLRFRDEFVRHKILDLIGDLALLSSSIKGTVFAIKSGHEINIEFVKLLQAMSNQV
jgi:UDP-3-O-acyl N-acetylglucosamine deacetylase